MDKDSDKDVATTTATTTTTMTTTTTTTTTTILVETSGIEPRIACRTNLQIFHLLHSFRLFRQQPRLKPKPKTENRSEPDRCRYRFNRTCSDNLPKPKFQVAPNKRLAVWQEMVKVSLKQSWSWRRSIFLLLGTLSILGLDHTTQERKQ